VILENYLHSPSECSKYTLYQPLPFSHLRYFLIKLNQIRFHWRNNSPYISGDSIASLTDYVAYGKFKNKKLNLRKLKRAKSVFVYGDMLNKFLKEGIGYINAHTIVTGNSDENFTELISMPNSVKLWLCQNNEISSENWISTLPIGIENIKLGRTGLKHYYKKHDSSATVNKILIPPMSPSNEIRTRIILQALQKPEIFDVKKQILPVKDYFNLTRKYRFIFACEGNGFENHRIWETLYQGSFPVLIESKWSRTLKYLNLPILYVTNLNEINAQTLLSFAKLHENFDPNTTECLWTPFWQKLIMSKK